MTRVLWLTDRGAFHQSAAKRAAPPSLEITFLRAPSAQELLAHVAGAEVVISERNQPFGAAEIAAARDLKLIVRLGSLALGIDTAAAALAGVRVVLQPVDTSINAAEHVVMMILALARRLGRALADARSSPSDRPSRRTDEDTFAYNWQGYEDLGNVHGSTIAILGMGEIGVELARRLAPFRPKDLLYNKRSRFPEAIERELAITYASTADCATRADFLVSLLPFGAPTAPLELMRPKAVLVHAGSGGVIDEARVLELLRSKRIAGAALDTFDLEPLPADSALAVAARDPALNLLLTPHIASGDGGDRSRDFAEVLRLL